MSEAVTQRPMTTTLARIKEHDPCANGWRKLLKHLGKTKRDDEPLPYSVILESNGLYGALWACRAEPRYDREWRLYAVWCAEQVSHLMTDARSHAALQVARRFANGEATREEWEAARDAAWDAAWAAWEAAEYAAGAGESARAAARAGGLDASWAAWGAASAGARAGAWKYGRGAAGEAAGEAARAAQKAEFLRVVGSTGGDHE